MGNVYEIDLALKRLSRNTYFGGGVFGLFDFLGIESSCTHHLELAQWHSTFSSCIEFIGSGYKCTYVYFINVTFQNLSVFNC